ncbi:MAG: M20/M25/M40 family metallo-hydrolase [Acidobacteriota bacterium]|nr:M20/M25/M40 family metallo-hydrolase [Acidobacteriota bacterium]MDH3528624.1 M20/M25/M40 family metallo-hydrolase [Acidobacteriota bacterium]
MLRKRSAAVLLILALLFPTAVFARTSSEIYRAPAEDLEKIKAEGMENSKVMNTLSYLTDVIGGRLTNSPNMKRANEWTRDTMAGWGMKNAHLEAWGPFGRGWSLKSFSAQVVTPNALPVIAFPKAWTPSTPGTVTGKVVKLDYEDEAGLEKYRGTLKGAIVFVSGERPLKPDFEGMARRYTDAELLAMANAPDPSTLGRAPRQGNFRDRIQDILKSRALMIKALNMLVEEGAAVMVDNSSKGSGGTVFVSGAAVGGEPPKSIEDIFGGGSNSAYTIGAEKNMIPQMTMSSENYNQIVRMLKHGETVEMAVNIDARYHDEDLMGYNTIAEIPGSDPNLKDEVVMLGAHLDSWHASGGATDNGAGSAVAMEAARIILAAGLKPRRTIRVGLWSGEEQGLNGSREYVAKHFGEMKGGGRFAALLGQKGELTTRPEYEKFSAYYNMDNGTGQFRGVYLQGNAAVADIFRAWLFPFNEMGASTVTINNTGGTDHLSFDAIGLPGFQFIQDPVEYSPVTHHSNQDNFDRILEKDLRINSTIMAAFVYQTAMMDQKIPRKPM